MVDKINPTNRTGNTGKTKSTRRTNEADGTPFADLLEETTAPQSTDAPATGRSYSGATPGFVLPEDDIPRQPEAHGAYLLAQLELLAEDILLGRSTTAIENLKRALAHSPLSTAELTVTQRDALEALHMRAAIEVEKSQSSS